MATRYIDEYVDDVNTPIMFFIYYLTDAYFIFISQAPRLYMP